MHYSIWLSAEYFERWHEEKSENKVRGRQQKYRDEAYIWHKTKKIWCQLHIGRNDDGDIIKGEVITKRYSDIKGSTIFIRSNDNASQCSGWRWRLFIKIG